MGDANFGTAPTAHDVAPERESALPRPSQAGELPTGTRVGRYVVLKRLGAGGMGVVYMAFDQELDRRVALKLLRRDVREAEGARAGHAAPPAGSAGARQALSHPNVVVVYDVGGFEEAGVPGDGIHRRRVLARVALRSAAGGARDPVGLRASRSRARRGPREPGILHRDFKPDNVVIDAPGRVRVLDFGVAKIDTQPSADRAIVGLAATEMASTPAAAPPMTQAGTLVGTPAYMAPNRGSRGEARRRAHRRVLPAFSVALYESLYGERPHDGAMVRDLLANARRRARSSRRRRGRRACRARVRRARDRIRGLRAKPEDRFASMNDLLVALKAAMDAPRRRALVAGGILGAAVVAGLVAVRPSRPVLCAGAGEEIAQTWGEAQRAAVSRAFGASGNAREADVWARIRPKLDDYAGSWAAMRTESCQATQVKGVQSAVALDLRTACLDQRRRELASTATLLAAADAKLVDNAIGLVRALSDLSQCADVASLRAPYAEPHDPAQRQALDAIRAELAEGVTFQRARKHAEAEMRFTKAASEAKGVGNRAVEAEAQFHLGSCRGSRGDADGAARALLDAALEADGARDEVVEARAWTRLVGIVGADLGRPAESELYGRLAAEAIGSSRRHRRAPRHPGPPAGERPL